MLDPLQVRAARAALEWSQAKLAAESSVSLPTIQRFEGGSAKTVRNTTLDKIKTTLEEAGVIFITRTVGFDHRIGIALEETPKATKQSP